MKYLVRAWGGGMKKLEELYPPDAKEDATGPLCYWFDSAAARQAFIDSWPKQEGLFSTVVADKHDPGWDDAHDEECLTEHVTIADVTMQLPDGRSVTYSQNFGYGYPASSVQFMYSDGNYACDCNRGTFAGVGELECGETLKMTALSVRKEPRDDTKPTARIALLPDKETC